MNPSSLPPQPYSRHLRAIAALLADRTDHRAALRELRRNNIGR